MLEGFSINASAVYDDSAIQAALGLSADALTNARRSGELKCTRQGRRILYLGQWILDWLEVDAAKTMTARQQSAATKTRCDQENAEV
jgi:hypothetical protein